MPRRRIMASLAPLFACCLLASEAKAGAIAQADFWFTMKFPPVTVNQFGFSGPQLSAPTPTTDWDGDGVIHKAEPSAMKTLQVDPRQILVTAGPIDLETTNEGDASAEVTGDIFGRLENLTSMPLTVTFNFSVGSKLFTHVDCFDCDFARADLFATFQIGDWFDFYEATSTADGPSMDFGFTGGDVTVTIPAGAVIPYLISWTVEAEVSSFCADDCTGPGDPTPGTPTPEPGTWVMLSVGLAGVAGRALPRIIMTRLS